MCGIFGYLGPKDAIAVCLEGLKKLEYRGYDSAGIAGIYSGEIFLCKQVGKVDALIQSLPKDYPKLSSAIAHTRWATHGRPTSANAHPQLDPQKTVAVVHNGVIENYAAIKEKLSQEQFSSQTDTETIAHLIAFYYQGDLLKAAIEAFRDLEGSFAVAVIHKNHPHHILVSAETSPLIIGFDPKTQETFIASDPTVLAEKTLELYILSEREIALLEQGHPPKFFNREGISTAKSPTDLRLTPYSLSKESFPHYMLKEIFEQSNTILNAMKGRYNVEENTAVFPELSPLGDLSQIDHIILVACGTSWHAAYTALYLFENGPEIFTKAEIASEYRYKKTILPGNSLVIALSQSGETADTIAAVRQVKSQKGKVLALCNVPGSTLAREADATIFLHAGSEVSVASTKTFTSQLTVLYLLSLLLARKKERMPFNQGRIALKQLLELPAQVYDLFLHKKNIEQTAKKHAHCEHMYFLGRDILYPIALEGALKLKEIAYINAVGYPAGEMKHGPIALLSETLPVVVLLANEKMQSKIMSNLMESKARGSPIIAIGWEKFAKDFAPFSDDILWIPKTSDALSPILLTIALQLFAYYVALERKTDIDQPRNLAKSVTVE